VYATFSTSRFCSYRQTHFITANQVIHTYRSKRFIYPTVHLDVSDKHDVKRAEDRNSFCRGTNSCFSLQRRSQVRRSCCRRGGRRRWQDLQECRWAASATQEAVANRTAKKAAKAAEREAKQAARGVTVKPAWGESKKEKKEKAKVEGVSVTEWVNPTPEGHKKGKLAQTLTP